MDSDKLTRKKSWGAAKLVLGSGVEEENPKRNRESPLPD